MAWPDSVEYVRWSIEKGQGIGKGRSVDHYFGEWLPLVLCLCKTVAASEGAYTYATLAAPAHSQVDEARRAGTPCANGTFWVSVCWMGHAGPL